MLRCCHRQHVREVVFEQVERPTGRVLELLRSEPKYVAADRPTPARQTV
jgi:hypothetical protein